ncbi:hypothetical protein [Nocardioides sp. HB32]
MLAALVLVAGCTSADPGPGPDRRSGCGPITFDDVRGTPPTYLEKEELDRFPNDHAVCAGVWLRTGHGFVPQGVAVAGRSAFVSGFDGNAPLHERYCLVERYDVRTGELLDRLDPVAGQVGDRDPLTCRHGGGLVRDSHGLWLVETSRLWLIDPETLDVEHVWALGPPLRGSFSLTDDRGRLGIGRWYPTRPAQVDWFDTDEIVASGALDITPEMSSGHTDAPRSTQGGVWAALAGQPAGAWFAQSVTRCGVLGGPEGTRRRAFVPGAEGMDLVGSRSLWVVSEAGTRHYQDLGGRPVVPQLLRLDVSDLRAWRRPQCRV